MRLVGVTRPFSDQQPRPPGLSLDANIGIGSRLLNVGIAPGHAPPGSGDNQRILATVPIDRNPYGRPIHGAHREYIGEQPTGIELPNHRRRIVRVDCG